MYAARLRATRCMGCGGPMPEEGRIDRRYCRPGCRTLAYRMRLRTRGIEHGPTAVPRWAVGRLLELAQALTTLGRVQGNVTVLARQMECEEAAVRAWLLRLRALGEKLPDVPVPEPEARMRSEAERLRADLDEALAQRNKLDEELRVHKEQSSAAVAKLRRELEASRKQTAPAKKEERTKEQEEVLRLQRELVAVKDEMKTKDDKLRATEQERASLRDETTRLGREVAALRASTKKRAPAHRSLQMESGSYRPDGIPGESAVVRTSGSSPAKDVAREQMEEQVANIRLTTSLEHLAKAREQGQGEQVQHWLSRSAAYIHEAAQQLAWSILTGRMGQAVGHPIGEAAQHAYRQTLEHVRTPGTRHAPEFGRWFQESEAFLVRLATALLSALDARSSTDIAPVRQAAQSLVHHPSAPQRAASSRVDSIESRRSEPIPAPLTPESVMPRVHRSDPLTNLMRDKVQLLHMLAEHQEERGEKVTGTLLEPMNENTVLVAARQAAREARREFYFRSRGVLSAIDPSWELEGEQLDARSEKVLFGEVMDQIDRLKQVVDKIKPKGDPW